MGFLAERLGQMRAASEAADHGENPTYEAVLKSWPQGVPLTRGTAEIIVVLEQTLMDTISFALNAHGPAHDAPGQPSREGRTNQST